MEAGHFESVVYLRLWSGDLQGALQLATEKGELNDHLLSIAPMGKGLFRVDSAYLEQIFDCFTGKRKGLLTYICHKFVVYVTSSY